MESQQAVLVGDRSLPGILTIPRNAKGLIIFAHGSGSSRLSPRNSAAARSLEQLGFATLLFDLLSDEEAKNRQNVFDMSLLSSRVLSAAFWAGKQASLKQLPLGLFGASTGAGAALIAAAASREIMTVVSRGGRPDLAGSALAKVLAPTLLIVGGEDHDVIRLNEQAASQMHCPHKIILIPGAGHLFEEPGAMEHVMAVAGAWLLKHLRRPQDVDLPFADQE